MANVQEIINEINSIKESSEKLGLSVGTSNISLAEQSSKIASLLQGSHSGQEVVIALSVASRSLADAASSMKMLGRTCESCIAEISK